MPTYLPNAEPFFYPGNRVGCLLIHGFTGTPYEMRELGERLAAQGYTVLGPALAGHATSLADMLPTRWSDWYASVTAAYDQLRAECDAIFPIGLSLGGALALHLAAHRPVDGVVAVSAPFAIHNPLIPFFKYLPFLYNLIPYVRKNPRDDDTQDPSVRAKHPEYPVNPTRCAASLLFDFLPHLHNDLRDIRAPALLIQARGDRTVSPKSMGEFCVRIASPEKETVWLERSGHLALEDYSKEEAFSQIRRFVQTHIPQNPSGR
ncbi:MAG: alpha/beta fold hydrolase [Chloroflexota bacterium]|nr:alpha/beta fold hydrolase [Chloroflexota bacterium]